MEGRHGILKSDFNAQSLRVSAASVRALTHPWLGVGVGVGVGAGPYTPLAFAHPSPYTSFALALPEPSHP